MMLSRCVKVFTSPKSSSGMRTRSTQIHHWKFRFVHRFISDKQKSSSLSILLALIKLLVLNYKRSIIFCENTCLVKSLELKKNKHVKCHTNLLFIKRTCLSNFRNRHRLMTSSVLNFLTANSVVKSGMKSPFGKYSHVSLPPQVA